MSQPIIREAVLEELTALTKKTYPTKKHLKEEEDKTKDREFQFSKWNFFI